MNPRTFADFAQVQPYVFCDRRMEFKYRPVAAGAGKSPGLDIVLSGPGGESGYRVLSWYCRTSLQEPHFPGARDRLRRARTARFVRPSRSGNRFLKKTDK